MCYVSQCNLNVTFVFQVDENDNLEQYICIPYTSEINHWRSSIRNCIEAQNEIQYPALIIFR
jgi:hypothetical protein